MLDKTKYELIDGKVQVTTTRVKELQSNDLYRELEFLNKDKQDIEYRIERLVKEKESIEKSITDVNNLIEELK